MAEVSRILAEGFQRSVPLDGRTVEETPEGPGLVILDDRDQTVSMTPAASRWPAELVEIGDPLRKRLPSPVCAVAARTRGTVVETGQGRLQARARAFTCTGRWLLNPSPLAPLPQGERGACLLG